MQEFAMLLNADLALLGEHAELRPEMMILRHLLEEGDEIDLLGMIRIQFMFRRLARD